MWFCAIDDASDGDRGGQRYRRVAAHVDERGAVWVSWPGGQCLASSLARPQSGHGETSQISPTGRPSRALGQTDLTAPMAARVLAVLVQAGDKVAAHAPLLVLEAMKMEHTVVAPCARTIRAVDAAVGDQVSQGQTLVQFVPEKDA